MSTTADNTIIGLLTTISTSGGGGGGTPGTPSGSVGDIQTKASSSAFGSITPGTGVATALAVAVGSAGAPVVLNGAGGTPSSLTLTNATGLPVAGITASTSTALGVGSINLGHASDTTIARSGAGAVTVEGVQVILSGAALGTPSSGTLTSCTGLPVAGVVGDTSTALGVGTIELGAASDTTIARSGAGAITVEGVAIPTISSTNTLTNKRITKRLSTEASNATPSINSDNVDVHTITAQAAALTSLTITGTPTEGQFLLLQIFDNGGAQTLAFGTGSCAFSSDLAAPTTTTTGKWGEYAFVYRVALTKWVMTGKLENIA